MAVSVRMASADEVDLAASLRIEFIERNDGTVLEPELADATRRWMRESTASGLMSSWVAEDDGVPIGIVTVRIRDASPRSDDLVGKEAYVHNLYVREAFRGRGIGRQLMNALIEWCKANGYRRV